MRKEQLYDILCKFNDIAIHVFGISIWLQPSSNLIVVKPMSAKTEHLTQPNLYDPELGNLIACLEPDDPYLWLKLLNILAEAYKIMHPPPEPEKSSNLDDLPF